MKEQLEKAMLIIKGEIVCDDVDEIRVAKDLAVQALENEIERLEGCKHCTGVLIGIYEVDESCCLTVLDIGAKICPNCGRELTEG